MERAEILVNGLVQGVGFRYYVYRIATEMKLNGFVRNLFSGEVHVIVEGERAEIEDLINKIKVGPPRSNVNKCIVHWSENKNEFNNFTIKHDY